MRKLAHTGAEDLFELIMRRSERASTLLTSNRWSMIGGSCWATPPSSPPCATGSCTTPCAEARVAQLAHQSPAPFAHGQRAEVELNRSRPPDVT